MTETPGPGYVTVNGIEYVTTAEAAERLGPDVTTGMIRDWTKRGFLKPAGRYGGRSNIYSMRDVAAAERRTRTERRGRRRTTGNLRNNAQLGHNLSTDHQTDAAQKRGPTPTCTIIRDNGRSCTWPAVSDAPIQICTRHMRDAYLHWRDHLVDMYRRDPDAEHDPHLEVHAYNSEVPDQSFVYYLRFADRIKIGYTEFLSQRLTAIPHDELLALEPGGRETERWRHRQFAEHRIRGEWFTAHPLLLDHVAMLRNHFGTPDEQRAMIAEHYENRRIEDADGVRRIKPLRTPA